MRFCAAALVANRFFGNKRGQCSEAYPLSLHYTIRRFSMNDQTYTANVKRILKNCISDLDSIKWLFLSNPEKDFTRKRKISFEDFINICLQMEGGALQNELMKFFDFHDDLPCKSAFCQQRAKVSPDAMNFLFCIFTELLAELDTPKTFMGYRLLACDGSDIHTPYNPDDTDSFHQAPDKRGYNLLHLNAFFDILNGIYIDCILNSDRKSHEREAFNTMIDRYSLSTPSIIMADRGYESYNLLAHLLRSGQRFIVRLKDDKSNGIISTYKFDYDKNGEFDQYIKTTLTWKQTNAIRNDRQTYTFVPRNKFDFYKDGNPFFPIQLRILCIQTTPDNFEYLATNLDEEVFPPSSIKQLYHLRWDQETSFRDLKFTIDLIHFHGKKREYIEQEIWAKLIVYNFCESIARHIAVTRQSRNGVNRKYDYKINFATVACICKAFLKRDDGEINPSRLIGRFLIPIRPDRTAPRKMKTQSATSFLYRAA